MDTSSTESTTPVPVIKRSSGLAAEIRDATGVDAMECYQCQKCSAGCPLVEIADVKPHEVMRMIQLGMEQQLIDSKHLWMCIGCETCGTRCPNELPTSTVLDYLRKKAQDGGQASAQPDIVAFHKAFLDTVKKYGRLHEVSMIQKYKLATGDYFKDMKLGLKLFARGKIKLFAQKTAGIKEIRKLFEDK